MKTTLLALALALIGLELQAQVPPAVPAVPSAAIPSVPVLGNGPNPATKPLYPQATPATQTPAMAEISNPDEMIPAKTINFQGVDVSQVLDIYADLVGRTLLRGPLPNANIILKTQTPLTKAEVVQALQAVLAINGIVVINVGDKFVKVVPAADANGAGAPLSETSATNLGPVGSYITQIAQLRYVKPSEMVPVLTPFAKLNSIIPLDGNGILIIRDYAENVKRMLEMIERVDISVPTEYISEVIPILYAKAPDIASALNNLGGSGGATVSIGTSAANTRVNGLRGGSSGGLGGSTSGLGLSGGTSYGGMSGNQTRPLGSAGAAATTSGTPTSGTTFQDRLRTIISRASGNTPAAGGSGQDQIQIFGQTKIIADERSNSLLVFATRGDMEHIKEVISQLDVLLAQVLIESIIMDVGIGNTLQAGVSAVQRPKQFNNSNVTGGGAALNGGGSSFLNTIANLATNSSNIDLPTNIISGGMSYFGSIGDTWDIAVHAAESDTTANIIQRPRIQTSQATPATFFVGQTVPYVTSTYNNGYNGGYGGSSYQQLSVGVELDVTPFINPEGLVVMQINQEIDEISGSTYIQGVGDIPNTVKRTLSSEIAVRNRDTVILGGFVRSDKSHSVSGVPLLKDIPLLGWLFRSTDNKKDRTELLVMMRPTVLKTPEIAAAQTIKEANRLPGVIAADRENADYERALIEAERKKQLKATRNGKSTGSIYMNTDNEPNTPDNGNPGSSEPPTYDYNASPASPAGQEKARAAMEQKMNELNQPAQDAAPKMP